MTRALIVDDEEDMRFLIRTTIETANDGLSVVGEASSGEEALDRWRADRPEVVVLDNRMPGMTGLEVAARMLAEHPGQPIILFSANLDDDVRAVATELGVRTCLPKSEYRRLPTALRAFAPSA